MMMMITLIIIITYIALALCKDCSKLFRCTDLVRTAILWGRYNYHLHKIRAKETDTKRLSQVPKVIQLKVVELVSETQMIWLHIPCSYPLGFWTSLCRKKQLEWDNFKKKLQGHFVYKVTNWMVIPLYYCQQMFWTVNLLICFKKEFS